MNSRTAKTLITRATLVSVLAIASATTAQAQTADENVASEADTIVVTGSLLRNTANDTPSPVSVLTAESLDQRGVQTTQEAIQRLASNNGPALTTSFTANGAFAAGASAVSLRGLSTNSTLVLFDGMRAAYYPLADDATRNFVDLNTIPDDIVDRIEVVRDGASSLYGADAIAGVVNVITKKQIVGISGRAEAGISQRGDGANQRFSLTGGFGDLSTDGFNVYVSGFYYNQNAIYNRDRPYPYNSANQSAICRGDVCGPQLGPNGNSINPSSQGYSGFSTSTDRSLFATTFFVAPYDAATNTTNFGRYRFLNPAAGCIAGETPYSLTAGELADNPLSATTVCQGDLTNQYGVISPNVERYGASFRGTKRFGEFEAFIQGNYLQSSADYSGNPASIRANGPAGISFPRFSTAAAGGANAPGSLVLNLPVYICPLVNGRPQACNASNGTLNPNNPFAAQGQVARILGRIPNILEYDATRSRTYRLAAGLTGPINDKWNLNINATGMMTKLKRTQNGYIYIQNLLNVIADGSYNFVNPLSNSQATLDYISPDNIGFSKSKMFAVQASVNGELFELPGGPLQLAVGGSFRYESINNPSSNDDFAGPTERYFVLNAFGTVGSRKVYSGFAEIDAPIVDMVTLNASGRYDKYSSGQNAFSPKVGLRITPVDGLVVRSTWSKGFRIPSFGEANALPTTGFVGNTVGLFNNTYLAQYGCSTAATGPQAYSTCPAYIRTGSYGQTTLASPNLKPEKSTSWTAGFIYNPVHNVTISVDYYNIKKTGAITTPDLGVGVRAYYAGQAVPEIFNIIPDAPDPNNPTAKPRIAFIQANLINSDTIKSEGLDFEVSGRFDLGSGITFTSSLQASYIINLSTTVDGEVQSYEGTSGNFNLTAGSGTPEWHGSWQNTLAWDDFSVTGTIEYFGGYNLSAEDQNGSGTSGDCGLLSTDPGGQYVRCNVPRYITVDLNTQWKVNDQFTFYVNVVNLFDDLPPIDPITYGANNFNPVQGGTGIFGRMFRAGVKVGF